MAQKLLFSMPSVNYPMMHLDEIADRVDFLAAIQMESGPRDRGERISHTELKKQLATWLTS
jgi:hypothetical protein